MSTTSSALHLLDDFIESIETVPSEIHQQLQLLHEKDVQIEDLQKNLFKKRSVLLKANEKSLDESMQVSLRKRAEKDELKASALLDEKIQIQLNLLQIVEQHLQRLEKDVYKPLDLPLDDFYPGEGILENIPEPQISAPSGANHFMTATSITSNNQIHSSNSGSESRSGSPRPPLLTISSEGNTTTTNTNITNTNITGNNNNNNNNYNTPGTPLQKVSPKKRMSLADEPPTDPNEPVYCYCQQVSWGDMIACDNQNCAVEWFHYNCIGLAAPPKGKWYCNECKIKLNLS